MKLLLLLIMFFMFTESYAMIVSGSFIEVRCNGLQTVILKFKDMAPGIVYAQDANNKDILFSLNNCVVVEK